jgi:tetratricopeptide (TPR) repeat protein
MAWVYPINCTMLAALRNISIENAEEILKDAQTYVFVKQLPNKSFKLHDEMQRMIEDYVWKQVDKDRQLRLEYSHGALQYFEKTIDQIESEIISLKESDKKEPSRQFELEEKRQQLWVMQEQRLKHGLILNLNDGLKLFEQIYEATSTDASIIFRPQFIKLVEDNKDRLSVEQVALLDYYRADQLFSKEADYESARTIIEALLQKDSLPSELNIKCMKLKGNIRIRQGEVDEAVEDFKNAVAMSDDEHTVLLIQSTNALGWAYRIRGDLDKALIHYQSARWRYLKMNKQTQELLKKDFGLLLNNLAMLLSEKHDKRQMAINMANTAIMHWKKIDNSVGLGLGYHAQGVCFHRTDHSVQCLESFEKALSIFKSLGLKEEIALILSWRGTQYHNIGRNEEAQEDLERSLEIGPKHLKAMTLNRLGRVHMHFQRWDKAQKCLKESLDLAQKGPDFKYWLASISRQVFITAKQGEAHRLNHFKSELKKFLDKFKKDKTKEPDQNAYGIACLGLAKLAFLQNKFDNIDYIVEQLKEGIPNIVLYGSYARTDIITRLGNMETDFHKTDADIIRDVGKRMIKFIENKEKDDLNYSTALEIMFRWADWQKESLISGEEGEISPPDAESNSLACKEDALTIH